MTYYATLQAEAAATIDSKRFLEAVLDGMVKAKIRVEKSKVFLSQYEGMEYYREYVRLKLLAHKLRKWMDGEYGDDFEENYKMYHNYRTLQENSKKAKEKALEILNSA